MVTCTSLFFQYNIDALCPFYIILIDVNEFCVYYSCQERQLRLELPALSLYKAVGFLRRKKIRRFLYINLTQIATSEILTVTYCSSG